MNRHLSVATGLVALLIVGCEGNSHSEGENYSDRHGLISLTVPTGWALKSESSGMRFSRVGNPKERTALAVIARPHDPKKSLEQRREIHKQQILQQGANQVSDRTHSFNGFSVWESVFTLGSQTVHSFYLFSNKVDVEVKLIALSDVYSDYASDIESVAESIRAL